MFEPGQITMYLSATCLIILVYLARNRRRDHAAIEDVLGWTNCIHKNTAEMVKAINNHAGILDNQSDTLKLLVQLSEGQQKSILSLVQAVDAHQKVTLLLRDGIDECLENIDRINDSTTINQTNDTTTNSDENDQNHA